MKKNYKTIFEKKTEIYSEPPKKGGKEAIIQLAV